MKDPIKMLEIEYLTAEAAVTKPNGMYSDKYMDADEEGRWQLRRASRIAFEAWQAAKEASKCSKS
jgi:hypothetical protein